MINQIAITKYISEKPFTIMGIVNVTPDSFFDGGLHFSKEKAIEYAEMLIAQGADILDFGGASSRPGAEDVCPEEEILRIVPVIEKIASRYNVPISIDTTWSSVARAAIDAGAFLVNDISAGRFDPKMVELVAEKKCAIILMHSRKTPKTMQTEPFYKDVITEVNDELLCSVQLFLNAGVKKELIFLDPGIGFAKTADHNITLLHKIEDIVNIGYPVVLGTSRKNFIGKITGKDVRDRLCGSLGSIAQAYLKGVKIFRVHDVDATNDFLKVLSIVSRKSNSLKGW
jgi:dihydropteroate synthase